MDGPVVIGFDGSEVSEAAIRAAAAVMRPGPALVVAVHEAGIAFQAQVGMDIQAVPIDYAVTAMADEALIEGARTRAARGAEIAREPASRRSRSSRSTSAASARRWCGSPATVGPSRSWSAPTATGAWSGCSWAAPPAWCSSTPIARCWWCVPTDPRRAPAAVGVHPGEGSPRPIGPRRPVLRWGQPVPYERSVMDWSVWDVIWTSFVFFCWIAVLVIFFQVVIDIFRSHDLTGWAKAGWLILLVILPLIGLLIYIGVRGRHMAERAAQEQLDRADQIRRAQGMAAPGTPADEIAKAKEMLDQGVIDDAEFQQLKQKALAT